MKRIAFIACIALCILAAGVRPSNGCTQQPHISLDVPPSLSATVIQNGSSAQQTFKIWNGVGGTTLYYTISESVDWLSIAPAPGTDTPGQSTGEQDTYIVTFSPGSHTPGTYTTTITITASGADNSPQCIQDVTMLIPGIAVSPATISKTVGRGETPVTSSTFYVWNSGGGTLSYSISDNAGWLSVSPASGTSSGEQDTITINYATSGLAVTPGVATITITGNAIQKTIPVNLTVVQPEYRSTPKMHGDWN